MPIYEYRCDACGFQKEHLQKLSDPLLSACPSCGQESYNKLLSAAGFQLKGSGWYATDFKNGGQPKAKPDTPPPCQTGAGSCASCPAAAPAPASS
jgi:putative FmdB family regulatory protein